MPPLLAGDVSAPESPGAMPPQEVPSTAWDISDPLSLSRMVMRELGRISAAEPTAERPLLGVQPTMPQVFGPLPGEGKLVEPTILTPEQANKQFGIPGPGGLTFDKPVAVGVARNLNEARQHALALADAQARRPGGTWNAVKGLGANFVANMIDPLNVAAAFVPVLGEERVATWMASAGESALARTAVRAGVGAISGAAGQLPLSALRYDLSDQEQADYTAGDVLRDVAMGALLGGGIGAAQGSLAELIGRAYRERVGPVDAATSDAAAKTAVSQVVQEHPVEVSPVLAAGIEGKAERELSLASFLVRRGGVQDQGGELAAMDAAKARPGLVSREGMTLDGAREAAEELGYLPRGSTISDLLDALRQDIAGRPVMRGEAATIPSRVEQGQQAEFEAARGQIEKLANENGVAVRPEDVHAAASRVVLEGTAPAAALQDVMRESDFATSAALDRAVAQATGSGEAEIAAREARERAPQETAERGAAPGAARKPAEAGAEQAAPAGRPEGEAAAETQARAAEEAQIEVARAAGMLTPEDEQEVAASAGLIERAKAFGNALAQAASCLAGGIM